MGIVKKGIRVLNRNARIDGGGLSYEGDPRHAEMLIKAFPETSSATTPGVREEDVDYDATLDQYGAAQQPPECLPITSLRKEQPKNNSTVADDEINLVIFC